MVDVQGSPEPCRCKVENQAAPTKDRAAISELTNHLAQACDNCNRVYRGNAQENRLRCFAGRVILPTPTFNPGTPRGLFEGVYRTDFPNRPTWDITPDGQRFLMIKGDEGVSETVAAEGKLILVQNWLEELKRLVPTE